MAKPMILVNLNRCTGCWTCSMACKVGNGLDVDTYRQFIRTIGGGDLDVPGGVWPDLYMKWMPIYTKDCTLCGSRTAEGELPFCVDNCPTGALTFGDIDDPASPVSIRKADLGNKGFNIFSNRQWEGTREGILYAERCTK